VTGVGQLRLDETYIRVKGQRNGQLEDGVAQNLLRMAHHKCPRDVELPAAGCTRGSGGMQQSLGK
jgi:hypothetical protein